MSFCINCGNQLAENDKFCNACGTKVPEAAPETNTYAQESVQPYYTASKSVEVVVSGKDKALGFVGMGLSIGGMFMAVFGILYTALGMIETGLGFGMAVAFSLFSLPLAIVGRVLSSRSVERGNTSSVCSVGRGLGLAGIIVTGVMLLLGIINLCV